PDAEDALIDRLVALGAEADAFIVSDYGYGAASPRVFATVLELARRRDAVVTVDSRYDLLRFPGVTAATPNEPEVEGPRGHARVPGAAPSDWLLFPGVPAATPNEPEVEALTGQELADERDIEKAGRRVLGELGARFLLVTRGSRGMALLEHDGPVTLLPIHGSDQIADVTGAGDTVISAFTVALSSGASPLLAAWLANVAGGVVVMNRGTAPVSPHELTQALTPAP